MDLKSFPDHTVKVPCLQIKKTSGMFWGQTRSLLLLIIIIIHGVSCISRPETLPTRTQPYHWEKYKFLEASCSTGSCSCGESVTITCNVTHKLGKISLEDNKSSPILEWDLLTKKAQTTENRTLSILYTQDKVMVTISKVRFSDVKEYWLFLDSVNSNYLYKFINISVSGICNPEISKNNDTNEVICEAESMSPNANMHWMVNHSHVYQPTKREKLSEQKSRISLNLTENKDMDICCVVSYNKDGVYEEKKKCLGEATPSPLKSFSSTPSASKTKNSTSSIVKLFLVVPLFAVALGFLIYKRNKIVIRDVPGEESKTNPPLLPPQTV
ncbi:uncharacterized protein LOC143766100 isoform X2 [Ranitomeya variabilis]|uniref:uncharacterized protein LOC143766100 isoform X2 n=1 Tax=Ranitomeya variabilis TaxID=490064 RepID=UPI0040571BB0